MKLSQATRCLRSEPAVGKRRPANNPIPTKPSFHICPNPARPHFRNFTHAVGNLLYVAGSSTSPPFSGGSPPPPIVSRVQAFDLVCSFWCSFVVSGCRDREASWSLLTKGRLVSLLHSIPTWFRVWWGSLDGKTENLGVFFAVCSPFVEGWRRRRRNVWWYGCWIWRDGLTNI